MAEDRGDRKELVKRAESVSIEKGGIIAQSAQDLLTISEIICASGLAPKGMQTASQIFVAIQTGAEAGLQPMQSLRSIYMIPGSTTPSWKAEAVTALIRKSGACEYLRVGVQGQGEAREGYCKFKMTGEPDEIAVTFSVQDAKDAKLWGKKGPRGDSAWVTFADDMLVARAVTRTGRRYFSGVLLGLPVDVEVRDNPAAFDPPPASSREAPATIDPLLAGKVPTLESKVVEPEDGDLGNTSEASAEPSDSTTPPWTAPLACPSCSTPTEDPDVTVCGVCGLDWATGEVPNE
jgi:hypothetical protein